MGVLGTGDAERSHTGDQRDTHPLSLTPPAYLYLWGVKDLTSFSRERIKEQRRMTIKKCFFLLGVAVGVRVVVWMVWGWWRG